jgi:hypothetical protein
MIRTSPKPLPRSILPYSEVERLRERRPKALSTGLATICTDGLVLCTEQRVSTEHYQYDECKLRRVPLRTGRGSVALGYAGLPSDTMKALFEAVERRLRDQDASREQIQTELQAVLDDMLTERHSGDHQLLCGFEVADDFHIFKTYNRAITPVSAWDCIGCGDSSLMRYLGRIFLGNRVHLPLRRAIPICIYMVAQAKKYVPHNGGPTDLIVLGPQGKSTVRQFGPKFDTACDEVEEKLNGVLTCATEPGLSTTPLIQGLIEEMGDVLDTYGKMFTEFYT